MTTAIYVAIIEGSQDEGYSAFFPDLPGCVTAAESMLELPAAAREALSLHLIGMFEDGEVPPEPTAIEAVRSDPDVKEAGRILVDVEVEDAPVRVNISVGAQFLRRVDVAAEARGMTRSGFLVEAARRMLSEDRGSARPDMHSIALAYDVVLRGGNLQPVSETVEEICRHNLFRDWFRETKFPMRNLLYLPLTWNHSEPAAGAIYAAAGQKTWLSASGTYPRCAAGILSEFRLSPTIAGLERGDEKRDEGTGRVIKVRRPSARQATRHG
jgi:predicted RNase H-like HicB family nuclease